MIVSHHHKFIFIAIPKTATHTVRSVLRPQLKPHDWEQCILFEEKRCPVEAIANIKHGHISCQQLRPYILPALWQQYTKFCVVRNPYSRFLSLCSFLGRSSAEMQRDPIGYMKRCIQSSEFRQRILARPQVEFICGENGRILVDEICQYETLQEDLYSIIDKLCLSKPSSFPQHNVSPKHLTIRQIDRELSELIKDIYYLDFRLFDYSTQIHGRIEVCANV